MQECSNREAGDDEALLFNLVDAFSAPRFTYCEERKKYVADDALAKAGPMLYAGKDGGRFLRGLQIRYRYDKGSSSIFPPRRRGRRTRGLRRIV